MRYELDSEGYVLNVYFGSYGTNCIEYKGNIPTGYGSLLEWSEKANINAYYIKDGNLTYNAERDKEICKRQELESEEYALATKGYVNSKLNVSSTIYDDNMTKTTNDLVIKDAGEYEIPEIIIEGKGDLKTATNKIEDARAGKSKGIKIEGKSYQETRSGKNLLPYLSDTVTFSNVTFTRNKDGSITINGTASSNADYYLFGGVTDNGEYYTLEQGDYKFIDIPSPLLYIAREKDNSAIIGTPTIEQALKNKTCQFYGFFIRVEAGKTINNVTIYPQLVKGSVVDNDFEQYGVSPSPDYPSEIKNVEGITNLCPTDISMWESGHYDTSGNKAQSNARIRTIDLIPITPNVYYGGLLKSGYTFIIRSYDKDKKFIRNIGLVDDASFTINDGEYYISVSIGESTTNVTYETYLRLFENNELNPFIILNSVKEKKFIPYGRWLEQKTTDNIFDGEMENGSISSATGELTKSTNRIRSKEFIDVIPNTQYLLRYDDKNIYTIAFEYDENSNFLQRTANNWTKETPHIFTTTSNTKKLRFIFKYGDDRDIFVEDMGNIELYTKENTALIDLNKENLFNKNDVVQGYLDGNGNIANSSVDKTSGFIKVRPNTTYTRQISNNNACFDENKNFISVKYSKQFTTPSNCKYVRITTLTANIDIERLYEGIETDDYYSFKENDTFENGKYIQKRAKIVLDGTQAINSVGIAGEKTTRLHYRNVLGANVSIHSQNKNSLSTALNYKVNWDLDEEGFYFDDNSKDLIIRVNKSAIGTTKEEVNAYLSEHPIEIEYVLGTPIEHTLDYETLEMHEGYNNITTNDDLEPNVDVTYIAQKTTLEDGLKVQVSNDNQLVNQALNHSINGLKVEVNEDKSITINGTATADTEIVLNGSNENVEPIFMLNDNNKFTLSGLTDDITLNLYNYDGTDKTLLFSGTSGEVNIEGTQYVTCSTLSIASGVKVNATITPMITASDTEYKEAKLNDILDIDINELQQYEKIKIDRNYVSLVNDVTKVESVLDVIDGLNTFTPTLIQTNQDRLELTTKYFPNDYLNERFAEVKVEQDNIRSEVNATYITKVDSANNISTAKTEAISSANSSTDNKLKNYTTTTNMNSAIDTAKGEAINSANSSTDEKLKSYSTTIEMNNAITQKVGESENSIKLSVSNTYTTKEETATAKSEAISSANSSTDEKLENYSTTEEVNASLELKINKDDLVSEINAKANVITLTSDNFKLDANGKITATSGEIGGWEIGKNYLYSDYSDGTYDYRAYLQPILSQSGAETWVYSIQKKKTNDTNYTGVYYVQADGTIYTDGTIHAEGCIETPSYILANDSIQSNTGFFTGKSYLAPNGAYVEKQLVVDGNVVTPYLATAKTGALNICGYGGSAIGGEQGIWLSTENNITLNPISGGAYVRIGDGSSYKISTAGGNLSSLSLKENLEEFKEEDYNDAIDLLREIDLYNFDYKYDINSYENNYGFIIDYIKENDKSNKFFNFNQYKAVVNKNKTLDEAKAQEEPDNENIIEYERYSEESLVKYLLTVCKAQQQQIDELKESIKALN